MIETRLLVIACVVGVVVSGLIYLLERRRSMSAPKAVAFAILASMSLYYILNVVFGSGRTGWP